MSSLLASILVVVVFGVLVHGAKLGKDCDKDDDCTDAGSFCKKMSDCEKGACACKPTYYLDGTACKEGATMLEKGDSCDALKILNRKQQCKDNTRCTGCKFDDTTGLKCRSDASIAKLTAPLLLLAAVIFKLF